MPSTVMKNTMSLLLLLLVTGCTQPGLVGVSMEGMPLDTSEAEITVPSDFALQPEEVFRQFGSECGGTYWCSLYADEQHYYFVPDTLTKPCVFSHTCAALVVDGRTGERVER
jgi:hypothetical protein